jgi:hypothetical protein
MPVSPTISTRSNGQVIDQTWFNVLKTALDTAWDDIAAIEAWSNTIDFVVKGRYNLFTTPRDQLLVLRAPYNLRLTAAKIVTVSVGASGTTTVSFQRKRGAGAWTDLCSTNPSVVYTAGALAVSTNGVIDTNYRDVDAGDLICLNLDGAQSGTTSSAFPYDLYAVLEYTRL